MTVLVYSLSLVLLSSFIKASKCESLAEDVSHPLARTADRLVTVTALWVFFQSASVYTFEKRDWLLVICQLWGATCTDPGTVFWGYSYSVYLWVLLPLLAWFGGSQVVVCGKLFVRETNNENMHKACYDDQYHCGSAHYVNIHCRRKLFRSMQRRMPRWPRKSDPLKLKA